MGSLQVCGQRVEGWRVRVPLLLTSSPPSYASASLTVRSPMDSIETRMSSAEHASFLRSGGRHR